MPPASENYWKLVTITQPIRGPCYLIGSIGEQHVVLKDTFLGDVLVTNLENGQTRKVFSKTDKVNLYRCVSLEAVGTEGLVACGTRNGTVVIINNWKECDWRIIKSISIIEELGKEPGKEPGKEHSTDSILVTLAADGRLMAAVHGSSTIHLINPKGWTLDEKLDTRGVGIYEVHAMTNGNILVRSRCSPSANGNTKRSPEKKDVCILDASGSLIQRIHLHDKDVYGTAVNRVEDSILVLYRDRRRDDVTVDVFSSTGELLAQRILSFRKTALIYPTFLWLTDSKHIVIHEDAEGQLYVFKLQRYSLIYRNILKFLINWHDFCQRLRELCEGFIFFRTQFASCP